ncbi:hypothetical protein CS063_10700 [Sporanaerobium hydrogeniformans]|uniref:Uncharacterized protein n=1 Tax=Sporanaerobium hydrogeniformans TaxID=3072179 RepID=A0AC61DAX1_9FIRM|nr:hypothetical protein [Sporanaerobium hydrogeniformans]PHV70350.1 hypothetical protein CS063_10700 [Sporanaerobium hydrogeniformans]
MKDGYYLKKGKLELSVLDEEIEEEEIASLKVSDEVYSTLKSMGEFLTQDTIEVTDEEKLLLIGNIEEITCEKEIDIESKDEKHLLKATQEVRGGTMQQQAIDQLLDEHFGKVKPTFKYAAELKSKIDARIAWIKSYSSQIK